MSFLWSFGTAAKKDAGPTPGGSPVPEHQHQPFKTMSNAFRRGVQYNMKIVIRGDVMTGKSTLFERLQGKDFDAVYKSTPQIQVTNIPWQYKDTNDIIKVEVWDVVDKAHNKNNAKTDTGIKLEHDAQPKQEQDDKPTPSSPDALDMALDANTVDVYRNSHAVLLLFDTTKQWTFDYVHKELPKIPENLSVLVLGNSCDKSDERSISLDTIHATLYEHNQERIEKGAIKPNLIRYAETSMKTGFGLKYIYEYLGVPFLQLQMESLKKQLELKAVEIVDTLETLDTDEKVPEIMRRRRGQDNFDQPSDRHLSRQQEEMQNTWDDELNDIGKDFAPTLDIPDSPSFTRKATPPPPTAPVSGRRREGSLASEPDHIPAVVDQFDAGELEDDWFGDDSKATTAAVSAAPVPRNESDNEGYDNPMVAGDEDVESVEYYSAGGTTERKASVDVPRKSSEPDAEEEEQEEEEEEAPVFRSEFENVWSSGVGGYPGYGDGNHPANMVRNQIQVESDSDDEDNRLPEPANDFDHQADKMPISYSSGFGNYEEIDNERKNPWSLDDGQDDNVWGEEPSTEKENKVVSFIGEEAPESAEASSSKKKSKKKKNKESSKTSSSSSGTKKSKKKKSSSSTT
ncbi:hypothetical protein BCR43DRAFT_498167 [Syncephalastrum racemosum]|uniref:P-loop containing nucleoside triphosphate hydrolase protein n=1 Tax=Syncephalastrum racemosum TaxID=13706 RepID=A0A1X2H3D0_SYNRA|nr:hypothetical protein BCR43DRAFT_498167 [Syncephalastrum racemosum]